MTRARKRLSGRDWLYEFAEMHCHDAPNFRKWLREELDVVDRALARGDAEEVLEFATRAFRTVLMKLASDSVNARYRQAVDAYIDAGGDPESAADKRIDKTIAAMIHVRHEHPSWGKDAVYREAAERLGISRSTVYRRLRSMRRWQSSVS